MSDKKSISIKKMGESFSEKAKSGLDAAKSGAAKAKSAVSASAESFVNTIDQTGDGKLGLEDIAEIKRQSREKQRQAKLRRDLNALNPIFIQNLSDDDFFLPKMIQLADIDKKHASSSICQGSIGHETLVKDLRIVTVYTDQLSIWDLDFYPGENQGFYYVDPVDPKRYISVENFFDYLRQARISELQMIAQDLGATSFKVTIREQKKTKSSKSRSLNLSGVISGVDLKAKGENQIERTALSDGEIAAQISFEGHAPVQPTLRYYKNEPQIKALIEMRMDNTYNAIKEQHLTLKCAHSSGITEKTAASLSGAMKSFSVNASFALNAQNEINQVFEYDIIF